MQRAVDFYFDFISPYSYFANHRLPQLAERYGFRINFHPVELKTLKNLAGNTAPPTRDIPLKLACARVDQRRWAARYGIPVRSPREYASSLLNKGTLFAADAESARRYVTNVFHKVWGEGGPMTTEPLLRAVSSDAGWDFSAFMSFLRSPEAEQRYAHSTDAAHARGVFGVPTMMIGDDLWWGNDRIDFLEQHLEGPQHAAAPMAKSSVPSA